MILKKIKKNRLEFDNRVVVSPMCQYSSDDGSPSAWHYKHLGALVCSGASMVVIESTAVSFEGRISKKDLCLYNKKHFKDLKKLIKYLKTLKNIPICIQLNHAGRKGSSYIPWIKKNYSLPKNKGWTTISSSNLKKDSSWPKPKIANKKDIKKIINDFYKSAKFAIRAGVDAIELHMAHGYLIHQFLSPVSNNRIDEYGGSFQKRSNLALEITKKIKKLCNSKIILGARITGEDHVDDGLEISDAINLSKKLEKKGIDYVCISSGGIKTKTKMNKNLRSRRLKISKEIKKNTTTILVGATGNMGNVGKLNHSIVKKEIDFAFVGRPFLRNSNWLIEYFSKIRKKALIPNQYSRGFIK